MSVRKMMDVRAASPANQLLRRLAAALGESADVMQELLEGQHGSACPCSYCAGQGIEADEMVEDLAGILWHVRLARDFVGQRVQDTYEEVAALAGVGTDEAAPQLVAVAKAMDTPKPRGGGVKPYWLAAAD